MQNGAYRYNDRMAKNYGLSLRAPAVANVLIEMASQRGAAAFCIDCYDAQLYRWTVTRSCSCLKYESLDGTKFADESNIQAPVLRFDDLSDPLEDQVDYVLNEAIEALNEPADICPVCFGTGHVGGYVLRNSLEYYLDTTYPGSRLTNLEIVPGRPAFFKPTGATTGYAEFFVNFPAYYASIQRTTIVPKVDRKHNDLALTNLEIRPDRDSSWAAWSTANLAALLAVNPSIWIKVKITQDTHAAFIRFALSTFVVKINFPRLSKIVDSGDYEVWDTQKVALQPKESVSTKDVLVDSLGRVWRVLSVDTNTPLMAGIQTDIGGDVELRRVRAFEAANLLP